MIEKLKHRDRLSQKQFGSSAERTGSRSGRLQLFFKIGILKNFANSTGKRLCWSIFLISCRPEDLQFHLKENPTKGFSCEICKIFKNFFSQNSCSGWLLLSFNSCLQRNPEQKPVRLSAINTKFKKSICCQENQHLSDKLPK